MDILCDTRASGQKAFIHNGTLILIVNMNKNDVYSDSMTILHDV